MSAFHNLPILASLTAIGAAQLFKIPIYYIANRSLICDLRSVQAECRARIQPQSPHWQLQLALLRASTLSCSPLRACSAL